jgi:RiboL-PSP-HEPN
MLSNCKSNLDRLENILPPDLEHGNLDYSEENVDQIRAYFLLVHAEVETFIEGCVEQIMQKSYARWKASKTTDICLLNLLVFYHPALESGKQKKIDAFLEQSLVGAVEISRKSFEHDLTQNNGIKSRNIEKMLRIIDFDLDTNSLFLSTLSSFSTIRGEYAHTSKRGQLITPAGAKKAVDDVFRQLELLSIHTYEKLDLA